VAEARYLLDANICIYILGLASSKAMRRLEQCVAEVLLGAAERDGLDRARRLFDVVPVLPFDEAAAHVYARLPFKRQSFDRLIAAQALSLGLAVVTSNRKDFAGIPDLRVEDWTR
jgi:tRNA(fMet)-specific endonuclease VapC